MNSSSLSFLPADEPDSRSSAEKEILKFPATIDGCGADGICTLKSRERLKSRSPAPSSKKEEKKEILNFPATLGGCGQDGVCGLRKSAEREVQTKKFVEEAKVETEAKEQSVG